MRFDGVVALQQILIPPVTGKGGKPPVFAMAWCLLDMKRLVSPSSSNLSTLHPYERAQP
jgi:hypothetical protein